MDTSISFHLMIPGFKKLTKVKTIFLSLVIISLHIACANANDSSAVTESQQFKDYWYQGKAEMNRYELRQARYGEIHKGDAVLVFVTEDFLTDKQVKLEHGKSENAISVLKLNTSRKFFTGIYPYSILTSTFTPIDLQKWGRTLKVSNSNQEWCGHTYAQINFRDGEYKGIGHSYFQDEADREFVVKPELLEDEVWTLIRLAPQSLPTGDIEMLPGLFFIRLRHMDFKTQQANAQLSTINDASVSDKPVRVYTIQYKTISRLLKIMFESNFPYSILAWEETYKSGFGDNAKELTTTARRTNTVYTDYWTKHSVADSTYRKKLGLYIQP